MIEHRAWKAFQFLYPAMAKAGKDVAGRLDAAQKYDEAVSTFETVQGDVWGALYHNRPPLGDVYNIAEHHEDRAWRIYAILTLSSCRYLASEKGDLKYIQKLLDRFAKSPDEYERAAAKIALELTPEDWNHYSTGVWTDMWKS
jgi:hypothetical protein